MGSISFYLNFEVINPSEFFGKVTTTSVSYFSYSADLILMFLGTYNKNM